MYLGAVWTSVLVPVILLIPYVIFLGAYLIGFLILYTANYEGSVLNYPNGYANM